MEDASGLAQSSGYRATYYPGYSARSDICVSNASYCTPVSQVIAIGISFGPSPDSLRSSVTATETNGGQCPDGGGQFAISRSGWPLPTETRES